MALAPALQRSISAILALVLTVAPISTALANPQGGNVVGGSATITNTASELQIHQHSNRALIEWSSFDIGAGETTRFYQPGRDAVALNRVVNAAQASMINGNLVANGRVIVINPNGVLIGPGGKVDTAGFLATSADLSNDNFMNASTFNFDRPGNADAVVENQGLITVDEAGLAGLVAPTVRNSGIIQADLGKVQLAAADTFTVDFYGDGLLNFAVKPGDAARKLSVKNSGSLIADGGKVLMTAAAASNVVDSVINSKGYIQARGLENRNGEIILTGAGAKVKVSGKIDASGAKGGGTVKIGGDYQGKGSLARAKTVEVTKEAEIKADATQNGNGGKIIVWSDEATAVDGKFYARGGAEAGNGGLIETSSKGALGVGDNVVANTLAANGETGDWLLDPNNLTIATSGSGTLGGAGDQTVNVSVINNAASDVIMTATSAININTDISMANNNVGITMSAQSLNMNNRTITTKGGAISLTFNGGNAQVQNAKFITAGGGWTFNANGQGINMNGTEVTTSGGNILFTNFNTGTFTGGKYNAGSGNITGATTSSYNISNGTIFQTTGSGSVTLTGNSGFTASGLKISAGGNIEVGTPTGSGASSNISNNTVLYTTGGNVIVRAGGGNTISSSSIRTFGGTVTISGNDINISSITINTTGGPGPGNGQTKFFRNGSTNVPITPALGTSLNNQPGGNVTVTAQGSNFNASAICIAAGGAGCAVTNPAPSTTAITVTANALSKLYGLVDPTLTYTYTGTLGGGDSFTGALARAAGENVGTYAITIGSLAITNAANYVLSFVGANFTINPALLRVVANIQSKLYGASDPSLTYNVTAGDLKFADTAGSVLSGAITRAAGENVGSYAITQGTLASNSNYTLQFTGNTFTINQRALTITARDQTQTYGDGNSLNQGFTVSGLQFSDTVTGATLSANTTNSTSGNWKAGDYTITASNATGSFNPSNYSISYVSGALKVNTKQLVIAATAQSKVYDGDADADVTLTDNRISGDVFTRSYTSATFNNKNVGDNKPVSVTGISISGTDAANYSFNTTASASANITKAGLTVTANSQSQTYGDGNTLNQGFTSSGLQGTDAIDTVSLSTNATNSTSGNWKAGTHQINISNAAGAAFDVANYTITYVKGVLTVLKKALTVTAVAENKVYDGNRNATVALTNDRIAGDTFTTRFDSARFDNKNVGTDKTVTVSNIRVTGGDSANYTVNNSATDLADITKRDLRVSAASLGKTYDGNDTAYVLLLDNRVFGDSITSGYSTAVYTAGKNAGSNKNILVSGINISGSDAGNYNLLNTTATTRADIFRRGLILIAEGNDKVYDGNDDATVNLYDNRVSGDVMTTAYGDAYFLAGKDVGDNKLIVVSGLNISGTDAANYFIANPLNGALALADITRRGLTISATDVNMTYGDGNNFGGYSSSGLQGSDAIDSLDLVTDAGLSSSGNWQAGNWTITASNASGSNFKSSNYDITYEVGALNIDRRILNVSASASNKVYDGNTSATVALTDDRVTDDVFDVTHLDAQFDDKNVGTGKTVTVTGIEIQPGTDSDNYFLAKGNDTTTTNADITQATLTVVADAQAKNFGAADPAFTFTYGGFVGGDDDTLFSGGLTRNPGEALGIYDILLGSLSAGGNYAIDYTGNILTIGVDVGAAANAGRFNTATLGRPTLSYADNVINQNPAFKSFETQTINTNVSLGGQGGSTATAFNNIAPAAGGSASDLNNLEPAAGGPGGGGAPANNSDVSCGNNFLDNKPCAAQ